MKSYTLIYDIQTNVEIMELVTTQNICSVRDSEISGLYFGCQWEQTI